VIVLAGLSFVVAAVNAAIRVMYTMGRERALPGSLGRLSHRRTPVAAIGCLAAITLLIGLPLTYVYGGVPTFGYLAGIGGLPVVLICFTVNIAVIRAFRTEFRDEFRPVPHLLIPAAASVVFLFPLWGILFPGCLHAGEPAALHFSWLAPHRCHCRWYLARATARHLPGPGKGRRTEPR
jgi:amino acid transporter